MEHECYNVAEFGCQHQGGAVALLTDVELVDAIHKEEIAIVPFERKQLGDASWVLLDKLLS